MKLKFVFAFLLHLTSIASAQDVQIQALPPTVSYRENDLTVACSITNPSQLRSLFFIQVLSNSSTTFETVVSIYAGQTPAIQWKDTVLQNRASATGSIDSPSNAQLRLIIDKSSVQCPTDFKMYMCKMSSLTTASDSVAKNSTPITISYNVKPTLIEMPRVRILTEAFDTANRQFTVGTAITLTCQGEVGSDASRTIRWCSQKANDNIFTGLPQTPIHSDASPSGCQYTRSSTITYNLTGEDTFTRFLCESGDTGMCGTGAGIQYVNITLGVSETNDTLTTNEGSSTIYSYTADERSSTINSYTTDDVSDTFNNLTTNGTSAAGTIAGGPMKLAVLILLPLLVV